MNTGTSRGQFLSILLYITIKRRNDAAQLKFLLRELDDILMVLGDAGYISRRNYNIVAEKNEKPFFNLKKNTTLVSKESGPWRAMIEFARERTRVYNAIYRLRSIIESIMSTVKRWYWNYVRAIKAKSRDMSIALRILAFNIKQRLYDQTAERLGVPYRFIATGELRPRGSSIGSGHFTIN